MGAVISDCGRYRYRLWRERDPGLFRPRGTVAFVMLNPSTADATTDDPTIRRCMGFAREWGFARLEVVNLFAYRATDPAVLRQAHEQGVDVVGPDNLEHLADAAISARVVVAAWGRIDRWARTWADAVRALRSDMQVLGLTLRGDPRHPLYVRRGATPVPWEVTP